MPLQRGGDPGRPGPSCRGRAAIRVPGGEPLARRPANASGRARAGRLADAARPSADGPRDGQPDLAAPFRPGDRGDAVQLRHPRRAADPSRAARLAGRPVRRRAAGRSRACTAQILLSRTYQLSSESDAAERSRSTPATAGSGGFQRGGSTPSRSATRCSSVSGQLDRRRPGPHPFPPIEAWHWTQHNPFKAVYPSQHRSVYLMTQRLVKHPFLAIFDGPDTNASTDVRPRSTVPLQALYLMNNPFVHEQAAALRRAPDRERRDRPSGVWSVPASWPGAGRPRRREIDRAGRYLEGYSQATRRQRDARSRQPSAKPGRAWQGAADVQRIPLCRLSSNDVQECSDDDLMTSRHASSGGTPGATFFGTRPRRPRRCRALGSSRARSLRAAGAERRRPAGAHGRTITRRRPRT